MDPIINSATILQAPIMLNEWEKDSSVYELFNIAYNWHK